MCIRHIQHENLLYEPITINNFDIFIKQVYGKPYKFKLMNLVAALQGENTKITENFNTYEQISINLKSN